ncbi:MAG: hypothetical protein FGM23_06445 [Alphaproteobacteria bacterium]|nr:hypothetical protein [Alphaproteobacteria bacterium]
MTTNNTSAKTKAAEALSATTQEAIQGAIANGVKAAQTSSAEAAKAATKIVNLVAQNTSKANSTMVESFDGISSFMRENLNAISKSSADLIAGCESILKQCFSFAQSQLESSLSAQKELVNCKNLRDVFETQAEFARNSYEQGVSEMTKISESLIKITNQSAEPIQARINVSIEKAFKSAA